MNEIKKRAHKAFLPLTLIGAISHTFRSISLVVGSLMVSRMLEFALDKKMQEATRTFVFGLVFVFVVFALDYILSLLNARTNVKSQDNWRGEISSMVVAGSIKIKTPGAYEGRAEADTREITYWEGKALPSVVGDSVSLVIALIAILMHDWLLSLVIVSLSLLSFIPKLIFEKWAKFNYDQEEKSFEDYIDWVEQGVGGAGTLKSYLAESWFMSRYRIWNQKVLKNGLKAESTSTTETMVSTLIKSVFSWGSYLIIGAFALKGRLGITTLPLMVVMSQNLLNSAFTITDSLVYKFLSDAALERLGSWNERPENENATNDIALVGVYKSFEEKEVLKGLSLTLKEGTKTKLVGENGSGKSTLMRILLGIDTPDKGQVISFDGKTAFLFQEDPILPVTLKNLVESVKATGECKRHELDRYISMFKLDELMSHMLTEVSEGERKKLFVAITLSKNASLLVLDEPTNHVDAESVDLMIKELKERNGTMLICTHDKRMDAISFDRTVLLEEGIIHE